MRALTAVSFNQAVGATTPLCTAILAYIVTRALETPRTYAALVPIMLGIVVASKAEPSFHFFGTMLCFAATMGRAGKSVVQGVLMTAAEEKLDPMSLLVRLGGKACNEKWLGSFTFEGHPLRQAPRVCTMAASAACGR